MRPNVPEAPSILSAKEAATFLGTTTGTLSVYRATKKGPDYTVIGRGCGSVFYKKDDLIAYKSRPKQRRKRGTIRSRSSNKRTTKSK